MGRAVGREFPWSRRVQKEHVAPRICIRIGNPNLVLSASMGNEVRKQEVANGFLPSQPARNRESLGGSESGDKLAEDRFGNDRPLSRQPHFLKRRYTISSVNRSCCVSFRLERNNWLRDGRQMIKQRVNEMASALRR
jgi:hypothetical protein